MAMQNSTSIDEALFRRAHLETPGFLEKLLPQVVELVRFSRLLPQGEEYAIRRGSRDFLASSKDLGDRTLAAAHQICRFLAQSLHHATKPEDMRNFNLLADSLDDALEKVDDHLRDAKSGKQREEPAEDEELAPTPSSGSHVARASKPQVRWRQLVDNHRKRFVPRLLVKHNEQTPLSEKILEAQCKAGIRPSSGVVPPPGDEEPLPNPYAEELGALSWPDDFFRPRPASRYQRMEDTPLVMVRTEAELKEMVEEIKATCVGSEIAVDVEHHHYRSFHGFVCLIQVSTRQKDFLIDPFDIFEQLHMLNEVFSDPRIVKVLHGADRDVLWLQRDFSVYLVNMFDTGQATRILRLQGGYSLANLVSHFCGVKLDKKYQTADWRERPLPTEMVHYARADTHYLLFCYDCLKNALLGLNSEHGLAKTGVNLGLAALESGDVEVTDEGVQSLQTVMQKSAALCGQAYREAPLDSDEFAASLSGRYASKQRPLDAKQTRVLKALADWRDQLARNIDESLHFVAPDACLWRVSLSMPTTPVKLRSTCNPLPATISQHAQEVVDIVVKSTQQPAAGEGQRSQEPDEQSTTAPALASPPESMPSPPESEDLRETEAVPAAQKARSDWPVRLEQSPRPLVHVTASFRFQGFSEPSRKRKFSVLCGGDSGSEEPAKCDGDDAEACRAKPQGRVKVIRRKISFAARAPAAAIHPAKPPEPVQAQGPGPEVPAAAAPEPEMPAPLRKRKKRRKKTDGLEQIVETQATQAAAKAPTPVSAPVRQTQAQGKAASAAPAPARVSVPKTGARVAVAKAATAVDVANAAPTATAAPKATPQVPASEAVTPRPKKRKKVVRREQETVVDPYL